MNSSKSLAGGDVDDANVLVHPREWSEQQSVVPFILLSLLSSLSLSLSWNKTQKKFKKMDLLILC